MNTCEGMSNCFKRILALVLALITVIAMLSPRQMVYADETVDLGEYEFMFSPENETFGILSIAEFSEAAKYKVTFSKKNIASWELNEESQQIFITAKKPGNVTVKVTVTDQNLKNTYKIKLYWYKYSNPLESLKIGSREVDCSIFDDNTQAQTKKVSGKKKINVTLKEGYELSSLSFSRGGKFDDIENEVSKISFSKKGNNNTVLFIYYTDPKGHSGTLRLFVGDTEQGL